jgi:hypothetical protein
VARRSDEHDVTTQRWQGFGTASLQGSAVAGNKVNLPRRGISVLRVKIHVLHTVIGMQPLQPWDQ